MSIDTYFSFLLLTPNSNLSKILGEPASVTKTLEDRPLPFVGDSQLMFARDETQRMPKFGCVCQVCLDLNYHSWLHTVPWLDRCFLHPKERLIELNRLAKQREGRLLSRMLYRQFNNAGASPFNGKFALMQADAPIVAFKKMMSCVTNKRRPKLILPMDNAALRVSCGIESYFSEEVSGIEHTKKLTLLETEDFPRHNTLNSHLLKYGHDPKEIDPDGRIESLLARMEDGHTQCAETVACLRDEFDSEWQTIFLDRSTASEGKNRFAVARDSIRWACSGACLRSTNAKLTVGEHKQDQTFLDDCWSVPPFRQSPRR
ncbi:hypothetical protein QTI33_34325 [Variovorax sp. J22P271]|uniref:hypothetical protein n=1 Tax=Variovorax davisae TaxID=3053515 RepID=UPI0025782546|nr:hypothetical protein [Variovorax sp. J22P271]MDM0037246.1 hypothetical protein [Variovorax sp. J22P271]